ncbi:hypothetical protein GE09DRAFT_1065535 [Coniochaeta sp. 2T2.1]|nr:hypothetical protein GE09DRAFT_1065535 [Coniochaeta sp. 2T2.1]
MSSPPPLTIFFLLFTLLTSLTSALSTPDSDSPTPGPSLEVAIPNPLPKIKSWLLKNIIPISITLGILAALLVVAIAILIRRCITRRRQRKNNASAKAEAAAGADLEMAFNPPARGSSRTGGGSGSLTPVAMNPDGSVSEWGRRDAAKAKKKDGKFGFKSWEERTAGMHFGKDFKNAPIGAAAGGDALDRVFKP